MNSKYTFWSISIFIISLLITQLINQQEDYVPLPTPGDEFDPSASILPPSPTASALGKYGEIPVSLYSGSPNVSVSLYELQGRGLSVPLSLSYHGSGVKVDEISSWVGLGWSLNAGGVISRTIRGKADEVANGFMQVGDLIPYPLDMPDDISLLNLFSDGTYDGQPDQFNFNVGGYTGKFVFDNEQTIRLIPHQNLKIEYEKYVGGANNSGVSSGALLRFTITTPDGLIYTFGGLDAIEVSSTSSLNIGGNVNTCNVKDFSDPMPTSWYLEKIYNPNTNDSIQFNYDPHRVTYDFSYSENHDLPDHNTEVEGSSGSPAQCPGTSGHKYSKCIISKTDIGVHLSSIVSSFGSVEFVCHNTDRLDLPVTTGNSNRLEKIIVKGSDDIVLRSFELEQDFWQASGYTPGNNPGTNYRMYLKEVTEKSASGQPKPPHTFTYYDGASLPPRLSFNQDHWGFYNGANNINFTPPFLHLNTHLYYAGADREPDSNYSIFGNLKKIVYPTGGHTDLEYERNDIGYCAIVKEYRETIENCSQAWYGQPDTTIVTFTLDEAQTIILDYKVVIIGFNGDGAGAFIRPLDQNNPYWPGESWGGPNYNGPVPIVLEESGLERNLLAGDYELMAIVRHGPPPGTPGPEFENGEFAHIGVRYYDVEEEFVVNKEVGGVRISKSISHDGMDNQNDVVKQYDYSKDGVQCNGSEVSSGVLMGEPKYITKNKRVYPLPPIICAYEECENYRIGSSSISHLSNSAGNHLGYKEVWELQGENGQNGKTHNEFTLYQDLSPELGPTPHDPFFHTPFVNMGWKCGHLINQKTYDATDNLVQSVSNKYNFEETNHDYSIKAVVAKKLFELPCPPPPAEVDEYALEYYDVISRWFYMDTTITIIDGVTTITTYEYDNPLHVNVTASNIINSDGKTHRTETEYAHEMSNQSMIDKWMHATPLRTKNYVDGSLSGGKKMDYNDFTFSGLNLTLPEKLYQILHNNTELLRTTVLGYDNHGNLTSFTKEPAAEHDPITIDWTDDLPTKKTFINWEWNWDYDDNTRQMTSAINIDGIETTYKYDDFQRLTEVAARNGGLVDSYSYHLTLADDPNTPNHIISTSGQNDVTTYQYMDGLGRGVESVKLAYSPDKEDVITAVDYDPYGQAETEYLPFLGPGNGTYVPPAGPADMIDYEDSPLGRQISRTFAGGGTVSQGYSSNGGDVKKFDENGTQNGFYNSGTLLKKSVTNENGNIVSTFTDKLGRTILVRGNLDHQFVDTYNVYDKRGNLVYVIPPGANSGGNDLSYQYVYDDRNRLISKRIPGAEVQTFTYNNKDELVTLTDGVGTILTNTYNDYGQLVSTSTGGSNLILNTYSNASGSSKGKIVNTDVMLLDGNNNVQLNTAFTYDNVGRVGSSTAQNHIGGNDVITNTYDGATDRIIRADRIHNGYEGFDIRQSYDFDHVKRLTDVWHTIDGGADVRLSHNSYDYKDRMIEKNLGGGIYGRYLQSIDYQYNLRNWLTHINQLDEGGHPIESCDPLPEQETEVLCGDSEITLEDLLELRHRIDDLNIDCYDPCAALNEDVILGDTIFIPEQTASLLTLDTVMAATTKSSINYPTSMYRVKLLNEQERMMLEEELPILEGGYLTDGCHEVNDSTEEFELILDTVIATKNLGELLVIRQSETPVFTEPDCEDDTDEPSCGDFSDTFFAHSINSSTIFSSPGPPLTDLSQFPGASNSLVDDNILWQLNGYTEGEAEWDIHTDIQTIQGTTVTTYSASVEVTEEIIDEGWYKLGLHDGNGFVKVNGGQDFITASTVGIVTLTPDTMPTAEQADNMVLAYELAGNISIDAVWVDIDYEVSCDCYITPPDCELSPEAEQLAIENIVYLDPHEVTFPTKLYRVMFCDGTEQYLLEEELNSFTGTYIIIQEIDLTSLSQTFPTDTLGLDRADLFAMRLYYNELTDDNGNNLTGAPQYNGNIANMFWQTRGRDQQHYAFTYDDLDRLTKAQYFDFDGLMFSNDEKYSVPWITYDLRGNITTLARNGLSSDCPSQQYGSIDNLSYGYNTKNQITTLTDAADVTRGFKKPGPGGSYIYDDNGNMTRDPNKGITIDYNHLNLPKKITFDTGEEIEFVYDASGVKLQKITREGGHEIAKDYVGGIEYVTEDNSTTLEAMHHDEGRAVPVYDEITGNITSFNYEYTVRDHLGNSRVSFSDLDGNGKLKIGGNESEIIQENHYYPFGMNMEGSWVPQIGIENAYQYNGKELNEDFGLNWSDYGARWYDASIGRWQGIDLLGEIYNSYSPYSYVINNPIKFIDPDGLRIVYSNKKQVKKDIRRAKRRNKEFRNKWKEIKKKYKGKGKRDLRISKTELTENPDLVNAKITPTANSNDEDTNQNTDHLVYSNTGVEGGKGDIYEAQIIETHPVMVTEDTRSVNRTLTAKMSSSNFSHWERKPYKVTHPGIGVAGSIDSNKYKRTVQVSATAYGPFSLVSGYDKFDFLAISKTIIIKIPRGLFGLKWGRIQWNYKPKPGEIILGKKRIYKNDIGLFD